MAFLMEEDGTVREPKKGGRGRGRTRFRRTYGGSWEEQISAPLYSSENARSGVFMASQMHPIAPVNRMMYMKKTTKKSKKSKASKASKKRKAKSTKTRRVSRR